MSGKLTALVQSISNSCELSLQTVSLMQPFHFLHCCAKFPDGYSSTMNCFIIFLTGLLLTSLSSYSLFLSQQPESFLKNMIDIIVLSPKTPVTSQTGVKSRTLRWSISHLSDLVIFCPLPLPLCSSHPGLLVKL